MTSLAQADNGLRHIIKDYDGCMYVDLKYRNIKM